MTKMISQYKLNWKPDLPDRRDRILKFPVSVDLPEKFELTKLPPVYDQGNIGSCTANASCSAYLFDLLKEGQPTVELSRLFLYYNTRDIEGAANYDGGAYIRDTIKSLADLGASREEFWPYDPFSVMTKPPRASYLDGVNHKALEYQRVPVTLNLIKQAIFSGNPLVFGFSVYESFYSTKSNGIMPMPKYSESILGGHAVLLIGWDDALKTFKVRNSWGDWGDKGNFYMPQEYVTEGLTSDYWQISAVT